MGKLSRDEIKKHKAALAILDQDRITDDDREQFFADFHPSGEMLQGDAGAFFTPPSMALDAAFDFTGGRVLDACAGVGVLSWAHYIRQHNQHGDNELPEIVAVEQCGRFVEIGRKLLPWVTWVHADIWRLPELNLGRFDTVISNPPFNNVARTGKPPRYTGRPFDLAVIDLLADYADHGTFIIPQMNAPFQVSGRPGNVFRDTRNSKQFRDQTGLDLQPGVGLDADYYQDEWNGTSPPLVEVASCDFEEWCKTSRPADPAEQLSLVA